LITPAHPNERLARVEERVDHIEEEVDSISIKVHEMHEVLMQAKGVRWAVMSFSALIGFLIGVGAFLISLKGLRSIVFVAVALGLFVPALADGPPGPSLPPPGKPDYSRVPPEIRHWFRSQKSPKNGALCCDEGDGSQAQEDVRDGQYWATWPAVAPIWYPVPPDVVLETPNRAGHPVVWAIYMNGKPVIQCFAPGAKS
jgi:hypothetical protein